MIVDYYVMDPTGNITVLVCSAVPAEERVPVADRLMEIEKDAEQVGYISREDPATDISLNMAGGEFCGNATLSTAAVYAYESELSGDGTMPVTVNSSGAESPVKVDITRKDEKRFTGRAEMPFHAGCRDITVEYGGAEYSFGEVSFKGIVHLISEAKLEKSLVEPLAEYCCNEMGADALGIMQIDAQACSLLPYVYVKKANTGFWESSCASGSTAAGYYLAKKTTGNKFSVEFSEPAGRLRIDCENDRLYLTGGVIIRDRKTAEILM